MTVQQKIQKIIEGKLKIRKARPSDARKIYFLRKDSFLKYNSKGYSKKQIQAQLNIHSFETIKNRIKDRDVFCLVDDKDKIIGTIELKGNEISGVFIRAGYARKGLGTKLMDYVENYALKKGIKKIKLVTDIKAYKFYLKHGYKIKRNVFTEMNKVDRVKFHIYFMEKKLR